jgi:hypothetical protein
MSNKTIIERLADEILQCEDSLRAKQRLASRFISSIEAMDGVPYEKVKEAERFEHQLTISAFHDEEGFEGVPNLAVTQSQMITWLEQLERSLSSSRIE